MIKLVVNQKEIHIFNENIRNTKDVPYPNFLDFIKNNPPLSKPKKVYLSLGDKEKNAKNDILKSVQDDTEEVFEFYKSKGIDVIYELNPGGHFKDCNLRTAKGIQWILSKE